MEAEGVVNEPYRVRHEVCPCCGRPGPFGQTLIGGIITPDAERPPRDRNRHTCSKCRCRWHPAEILVPGVRPGDHVFAKSGSDEDDRWHIQSDGGVSLCGLAPRQVARVSCEPGTWPSGVTCGDCLLRARIRVITNGVG